MDLVEVNKRNNKEDNRHPWELARFQVVRELLTNEMRNERSYNVLDIGCGDIFFISALSDLYPECNFYAVDTAFTPEIINTLKQQAGTRKIFLFKELKDAEPHLQGKADLVLLLDVVEHIEDDLGFLKGLKESKAISTETRIMITVPAFQKLFCSHDHFLGHYRRYTNKTLLKVIRDAGFEKIKMGYFFSSLLIPRILQVIAEKISNPKEETTGLVAWDKGPGMTSIFTNILLADFKISKFLQNFTGIRVAGLSNYLLCKKSA
jgi:hypothetical protein